IPLGGVADAVAALAVGGEAQVLREYRLTTVARGQREGRPGLERLGPQRAWTRVLHAGHLHGDGRCARTPVPQRAGDGDRVDAGMGPEAPVFEREGGGDDALRRGRDPVAVFDPVAIVVAGLRDERAVPVDDDRGWGGRFEM